MCGEHRVMALLRHEDICRNCSRREKSPIVQRCPICNQSNVIGQLHHVAGKDVNRYLTVQICISCHSILTYQQQRWTNTNTIVAIWQGLYDIGKLTLESYQLSGNTPIECISDISFIYESYRHLFIQAIIDSFYRIGFRV